MATVDIKPHMGLQNIDGQSVEVDTGIDAIFLVGKEWPVPKRVGYVQRENGAAVTLTVELAETDKRAVLQACADRQISTVSTVEGLQQSKK